MKKPVMQRSMFVAIAPKSESKGILSGFDEEMENEDYEERSPDNLEIIANNLRGDIRSMDERYLELAQLVGEAAFETPEEVVALMQSQMGPGQPEMTAPPTQGGIASLGEPPAMPTAPQGVMQGVAEPESAPQQPLQMAHGGIVHRQFGSPLLGEMSGRTVIDNELLRQATQGRPGVFSRMMGGVRDITSSLDDRVSNFLSRQLQTTGPTTASGKPIPFVDKYGRFYQPVGGTNPNMPSRGFPMPSKFSLGRMTKFGGPVGVIGGVATNALIESDPSRGQLYGSMFDLETGAGAEERAGFPTTVSRVSPTTVSPPTEVAPETAPGTTTPQVSPGAAPIPTPEKTEAEKKDLIPPPEPPKPKTYDERVQDRLGVFTKYLGTDPEMRKAQALFLLAEAALNVAGAKGKSTGERLAVGLKGLPAGMAAIGAEAEKERRSIAASAISAVESDIQNAFKYNQQLALQAAKNAPKTARLERSANYLMNRDGITQEMLNANPNIAERYLGMAQMIDDKLLVVEDKTGDVVDPLGRPVPGFSRAAPNSFL